nr:uncharacterized protein LOC127314077 isoform X1 [Lolium perenne]
MPWSSPPPHLNHSSSPFNPSQTLARLSSSSIWPPPLPPLFLIFPLLSVSNTGEKPHSTPPPRHGAAATGCPSSIYDHRRLRLILLFHLVQGIDPGGLQSSPIRRFSRAGRRLSSSIPAALVFLQPNRAHHRVPHVRPHLRRHFVSSGSPQPSNPPPTRAFRHGCISWLDSVYAEPYQNQQEQRSSADPPPVGPRPVFSSGAANARAARSSRRRHRSDPAQDSAAFASSRIGSRSGDVRYDKSSGCFSASFNRYEDMFDEDDASKVTLPAWPGQGYGRH